MNIVTDKTIPNGGHYVKVVAGGREYGRFGSTRETALRRAQEAAVKGMAVDEISTGGVRSVAAPIDADYARCYPVLRRMSPAERIEVVAGIDRLTRSGYSPDAEEAAYVMDEVCGLPDGTSYHLYEAEWGPMHD